MDNWPRHGHEIGDNMKLIRTAAAVGLIGIAACAQPASQEAPAAEALPGALSYDCGGGKLEIAYGEGGMMLVKTRYEGGAIETLEADPEAENGITYKAGSTTLVLDGADATYTADRATKECKFMIESIPAPKVDGVVHALTESDAGKSFDMKVGEKISVAFVGVPTAGYVWGASTPPEWVKVTDGPGGATSTAQMLPGYAGGNHWEVLVVEAVAVGEGELKFAQRRPWEDDAEPAADTFKITLKAS